MVIVAQTPLQALERDKDAPDYEKRKQALVEQQLNMQCNAVVPESAELVTEDTEFALYRVVLFKSARQSFEMDINSKSSVRVIVRDYSYKEGQSDADKEEVRKLEADEKESKKELKRWCISYFSEAYRAWIHLKVKSKVKLMMEIREGKDTNFQSTTQDYPRLRRVRAALRSTPQDGGDARQAGPA